MILINRKISLVIALIMLLSIMPTNIANAAVGDTESDPIQYELSNTTNFPQAPNQGYVLLNKNAEWMANEDNVAKVTMSLQGKGVQKETDVVLVIDRSGSMSSTNKVTRTVAKEVEVDQRVEYNEIQLTFVTNRNYQYKSGGWYNKSDGSIDITAYVDNEGVFRGYKTVNFNGLKMSGANKYRIVVGDGFNDWVLSNNNCVDAVMGLFSNISSQQTYNGVHVVFPINSSTLLNTQSYKVEKVKEIQYITETVDISKILQARDAAKAFINALLPIGVTESLNRVAVVSYAGDVTTNSQLTSERSSLNTAIDGISASGGTHIQAGIARAQSILSSSSADNKCIVVLSDGEPTYSYKATSAYETTSDDLALNYPSDLGNKLTEFDTNSSYRRGTGSSYYYNEYDVNLNGNKNLEEFELYYSKSTIDWMNSTNLNLSDYNYYYNQYRSSYYNNYMNGIIGVLNNGIPTISQALIAKTSGIEMYSVGFDVTGNSNAIYTMQHVASSNDNFYLATDDLSGAFTNIAGKILKAGTNAKVNNVSGGNSTVGYSFTILRDANHPVTATQGSAVVSGDLKSISWDLGTTNTGGDITETPATLTYYVRFNVLGGKTIDPNQILNTSNQSTVTYKNYLGKWCNKEFPTSVLTAESGTLNVSYYLADKNGNPINSDGTIISFNDRVFIIDSLNQAVSLGYSIKVSDYAKLIGGYVNQSTIAKNEIGVNSTNTITANRSTIYLNFPYYVEPTYNVLYNGNGNTSGEIPLDSNAYKTGDSVIVLGNGSMVKSGYSFKGWSTTNNGAVEYTTGSNFQMPSQAMTLYAVWEKSQYDLTINYKLEGLSTFDTYKNTLSVGQDYNVTSPKKGGWTANDLVVSGKMPDNDLNISVIYKMNYNKLINNTMYPSKGISPIVTSKSIYEVSENIDYTFGFKFESGQDEPNLNIILSGDTGKYSLNNFKLYEGVSTTPISTGSTLGALDITKIKEGKTYTITYNMKCNQKNSNLTLEVKIDNMTNVGVENPISIISKDMPDIQ